MALVREVLREKKGAAKRSSEYFDVSISDEEALEIFGARVYDEYKKVWIEDDKKVIFMRSIAPEHAGRLSQFIKNRDFEFNFKSFNYFFLTSED